MAKRVMGMETEYAISGQYANGDSMEKAIPGQRAASSWPRTIW